MITYFAEINREDDEIEDSLLKACLPPIKASYDINHNMLTPWQLEVIKSFMPEGAELDNWAAKSGVLLVDSVADNKQYLVIDSKVQGEFSKTPAGDMKFSRCKPWDFILKHR